MKYRRLGSAGLKVSALGLGCNTFGRFVDAEGAVRIVHAALDLGITFFDTADVYGGGRSEEFLGKALAGRRDRAVVATKVGWALGDGPNQAGVSRARLVAGIDASLRRLQTDYVDLLQIHRWDPETPLEESLGALDDLVRQGKVRYIGCSNFAAWQLVWSLWLSDRYGWSRIVTVQPEYSLLVRDVEEELMPACRAFGIGIIPYYPLAAGVLTGKYRQGEPAPAGTRGFGSDQFQRRFLTPRNLALVETLEAWARARGHSVAELAIAWLLARPMVCTVITGTTRPEQVEANAKAVAWELTPAEVDEVAALVPPGLPGEQQ